MALGRPVVVTHSGALAEIVGPAGVFVATRNAAALAEGLAAILADPGEARRRGEQLSTFAKAWYDASRQSQALLGFFRDV